MIGVAFRLQFRAYLRQVKLLIKEVEPFVDAPILRLSDFVSHRAYEVLQSNEKI